MKRLKDYSKDELIEIITTSAEQGYSLVSDYIAEFSSLKNGKSNITADELRIKIEAIRRLGPIMEPLHDVALETLSFNKDFIKTVREVFAKVEEVNKEEQDENR